MYLEKRKRKASEFRRPLLSRVGNQYFSPQVGQNCHAVFFRFALHFPQNWCMLPASTGFCDIGSILYCEVEHGQVEKLPEYEPNVWLDPDPCSTLPVSILLV
jgi:hypothetical protein